MRHLGEFPVRPYDLAGELAQRGRGKSCRFGFEKSLAPFAFNDLTPYNPPKNR